MTDDTIICFGKYKHKTYKNIVEKDVEYCKFVIDNESLDARFVEFRTYLLEHHRQLYEMPAHDISVTHLARFCIHNTKIAKLIENLRIEVKHIKIGKFVTQTDLKPEVVGVYLDY